MTKHHHPKTLLLAAMCLALLVSLWGCGNQGESAAPFPTNSMMAGPTPAPANGGGNAEGWEDWAQGQSPLAPSSPSPVPTFIPTPTPMSVPAPTPTTNPNIVKYGDLGDRVTRVQKLLIEKGYLAEGSADGDFGYATDDAVRAFQRANGISGDGVVGPKTMELLESPTAIKQTTPEQQARATDKPKVTAYTHNPDPIDLSKYGYLKEGDSGSAVTKLQKRLIELGYLGAGASGTFDATTTAAVTAFQGRNGEWEDGIAGPGTQSKLYASDALPARK